MSQSEEPVLREVEVILEEVQYMKVSPKEGETLMFMLRSDDLNSNLINILGDNLRKVFPNNKVVVFGLGKDDSMGLISIMSSAVPVLEPVKKVDCSEPMSYCDNCSCGKKETLESK